jgi:hypothetical protein
MSKNLAQDGYSKPPSLTEGYVRKGGTNSGSSQVQVRPPAPAPMKPGASQGQDGPSAPQGSGSKQS